MRLALLIFLVAGPISAAELVTPGAPATVSGAEASLAPAISADGRYVVFLSSAANLVTNDDRAPHLDVFMRDLVAGTTTLVSVNLTGWGGGDGDCLHPSISSNGQFVAFASSASNLVSNDTNDASDIFVRDILAGTTRLVSATPSGGVPPNPNEWLNVALSTYPLISSDGLWVVFESAATNLVTQADTNAASDVFACNLTTGETLLVSVNESGDASAAGPSELSSISADGQFVAFVSTATNIVLDPTDGSPQVYVRALQRGTGRLSRHPSPSTNYGAVLSANGQFLFFNRALAGPCDELWQLEVETIRATYVGQLDDGTVATVSADGAWVSYTSNRVVKLWDRQSQTNSTIGPGQHPVISADGTRIAYLANPGAATNAFACYVHTRATTNTELASLTTNGLPATVLSTATPLLSADAQKVVFVSNEGTLVDADFNDAADVFVRDVTAMTTQLVSQRSPTLPQQAGTADAKLFSGSVSSNGQVVVFSRLDDPSVQGDTNKMPDIFVFDALEGTVPVSVETNGAFRNGYRAESPVVSAAGRYAAFVWREPNRPSGGALPPTRGDLYWRDLENNVIAAVSLSRFGDRPANGESGNPDISPDGRFVVFDSNATDIMSGVPMGDHVYLRDMIARTNAWISVYTASNWGGQGWDFEREPHMSPDGRWIVFLTRGQVIGSQLHYYGYDLQTRLARPLYQGPNATTGAAFSGNSQFVAFSIGTGLAVYRHDLLSTVPNITVCSNCLNPSLSWDGNLVTYETAAGTRNIHVRDIAAGQVSRITTGLGGAAANGDSTQPQTSSDGRYVVFTSRASNLVADDTNGLADIFVRDRRLGVTYALSLAAAASRTANYTSTRPVLAADGRTVVFESFATDLAASDYNLARDLFAVRLRGADSDADGLDDDWELAYFNTLARDGSADFDGDGQNERAEFLAGTDPTAANSVFTVIAISRVGSDSVTLLWSAVSGRTYQVQSMQSVEDAHWIDIGEPVTATADTASQSFVGEGPHQFYRVVRLP